MRLRQRFKLASKGQMGIAIAMALMVACVWTVSIDTVGATTPQAQSGLLDLNEWHLDSDGPIPLKGEWEFYWSQLLEPDDFALNPLPSSAEMIIVPGRWNEYARKHESMGGGGYATYRLRIRLPDNARDQELALHIPWVFSSYRLWVNDQLIASNGTVGSMPEHAIPQMLPVIAPIGMRSGTIAVTIQISNFTHRNGGLWNVPMLGTYSQLAQRAMSRQVLNAAVAGAIFLMAVYHFIMYFMVRRWIEWFYLGLTAIFTSLRTLVTGEHVLGQIVGGLPWGLEIRAEYISGYAFMFSFMGFLGALFPKDTSNAIVKVGQIIGLLGIVTTLIAPVKFSSLLIPHSIILSLILILYCTLVFFVAWRRNREGAAPLLLGGVVLMFSLAHDLLQDNLSEWNMALLPIGMSILLLVQSFTVARRFSTALHRERALAGENSSLLQTVQTQLEEVKRSRRQMAKLEQDVRRKIAERLHGSTQNRLLKAWYQLAIAKETYPVDHGKAEALIDEVRTELEHIREVDIRQVSHQLHPTIVHMGLLPAIESLTNQYGDILPLHVDLDEAVQALDENCREGIPEPIRLVVFRVLEECLGNIHAHAHATSVHITIELDNNHALALTIRDNGRGFDPQRVEPHLGLHTIAAAVASVDGHWELDSAPGKGTQMRCRIPLGTSKPTPQSSR